ncbi:MAG: hypothetical protein HY260_18190 [Chloroflexi bacterium]|nr:hypothetical protein [Chloroflexota bacterium]
MIASAPLNQINRNLDLWLLRLRFRDAVQWGVRGLSAGLAAGLGFALMARLKPLFTVSELINVCAGFAVGGLLLFVFTAWVWPRSKFNAAQYFDRVFGLKERTSTALEIGAGKVTAPDWLVERQLRDALSVAEEVDPGDGLPIHIPRVEWLLALVLLASIAASLAVPNPQDPVLAQQRAVEAAIKQAVQQIETTRRNVQNNPALTDDQKKDIAQPLEEAQRQLQQGNLTREQAVAVLTQSERQLQQLSDPTAQAQSQALQNAGQGLQNNATTEQLGKDLASGDLQAAARDLANLDVSKLSQTEQQNLANELQQAANAVQATNQQLASQLQQAANALRSGNTQAAQQALNQASQTLSQTAQQLAQSQAASAAAGQVGQSRQTVARAGQAQPGAGGQGQQGQQGAGGQGQGQQGQGSSQTQGQGPGGGGAGRGEGNGQSQGSQAGNQSSNDNGPGDGGQRGYEPIYAPSRLGGSGGPEVHLPGTGDPNDQVVGQGNTSPQNAGNVTVPYNQVFGEYNQAAHDAIRTGNVPIGLRPVVRDYFSSLQP